jgi:4-hydroxy-3-methylbut-2-enyl diphosphate reductase IspH
VKGKCHVIISGIVVALVWKDLKKTTATISVKAIVIHNCQVFASWKEMQFKFCTNFLYGSEM